MEEYKKKYEQALENLKKIKAANKDNKELVDFIEYEYPELKESEDERIRRDIIRYLKKTSPAIGENIEKMLDWLEKQGKKSHCNGEVNDETLQKQLQIWFDKGKCSGRDEVIFHPENFGLQKQCEQRIISKTEPIVEGLTTEFQKQVSHLIASAINKEHEYNQSYVKWTANALLNYAKQELESQGEQKPVISDDGLREGIAHFGITQYQIDNWLKKYVDVEKQGEQKPAWSKENSCYYDDICEILINLINSPTSNVNKDAIQKDLDWLMSIGESQLKSAWSEKDEDMLQQALSTIRYALSIPADKEDDPCFAGSSTIAWLKSLKERMKGE